MNKQTLWGSIALASTLAITGCNDSGSDSDSATDPKPPAGDTEVNFTLLQTTDLHHHAETYARLATQVNAIKKEAKNPVVLVDSGDFVMGTVYDMTLTNAEANQGHSPAGFQFLKDMNYDVVTLGNHEFDYGDEALARWLDNSVGDDFPPIVATNLNATGSPTLTRHIDGTTSHTISNTYIQTLFEGTDNEIKVGFIGLMGPKAVTTITNAPGVTFDNDKDNNFPTIQTQINTLRNNADIVIALSHSGLDSTDYAAPAGDDIDYAKAIKGIDIIATGHAHTLVGEGGTNQKTIEVKNGDHTTYIFGGGAYGDFLAQLDITFTTGTNKGITGIKLTNHDIKSVTADLENDMVKTIDQHVTDAENQVKELANINDIDEIVAKRGSTEFKEQKALGESSLGNLLADATRYSYTAYPQPQNRTNEYTIKDTPVSLVANGVIRSDFSKSQDITFSNMYDTLSLGLSIDKNQQNLTGSPLFMAYLTAQELENVAGLIGYGLASEDPTYLAKLEQQTKEEEIVAAGINLTGILNDLRTGTELELSTLLGHIDDMDILMERANAIGIDLMGTINDVIKNGKPFQEAIMSNINLIKFGKALATVNLTPTDILSLISGQVPVTDPASIKTILGLLELLEQGTTTKLLTSSAIKLVVISQIQPEWYLNASGLRATFDKEYEVAKVELYQRDDTHSQGAAALTELFEENMKDSRTLYPVIADQYMLLLMYGPEFSLLRNLPDFAINPKTKDGKVIEFDINKPDTHKNLLDMAMRDSNGNEVKAWQALHTFFKAQASGDEPYLIPDALYNEEAMKDDSPSSRVNRSTAQ